MFLGDRVGFAAIKSMGQRNIICGNGERGRKRCGRGGV